MPRRTGRVRVRVVGPAPNAKRTLYIGEERRKNIKERRIVPERRAMPTNFLQSVVLGRRRAGMSDAEIANARNRDGRRGTFPHSKIESAMPHELGLPVQQTTRRASTTRRMGFVGRKENSGTHKQTEIEWKLGLDSTVFVARHRHKQAEGPTGRRRRSFGPVEDDA
ncbi:MAG: hypothetical protein PHD95_02700 [Candidatus ainarchaeum sp.]|nr:hypothetical protein [Candidatus ainarchaeum sp.]